MSSFRNGRSCMEFFTSWKRPPIGSGFIFVIPYHLFLSLFIQFFHFQNRSVPYGIFPVLEEATHWQWLTTACPGKNPFLLYFAPFLFLSSSQWDSVLFRFPNTPITNISRLGGGEGGRPMPVACHSLPGKEHSIKPARLASRSAAKTLTLDFHKKSISERICANSKVKNLVKPILLINLHKVKILCFGF